MNRSELLNSLKDASGDVYKMEKLISSDVLRENLLVQYDLEGGINNKEFERFLKYRLDEGCYDGVDLDVSLVSVIVYAVMHRLPLSSIEAQTEEHKKYQIVCDGIYRGDTITSAFTVLKIYIEC